MQNDFASVSYHFRYFTRRRWLHLLPAAVSIDDIIYCFIDGRLLYIATKPADGELRHFISILISAIDVDFFAAAYSGRRIALGAGLILEILT